MSNRLGSQLWLSLSSNGRPSRTVALRMVSSLRMQATKANRNHWKGCAFWGAMRCLKRQLADVVYRAMLEDCRNEELTT